MSDTLYEAAGGRILRYLFQGDDGGWLEDLGLLDKLVAEKLQAEAERIASEGWKWIEVSVNLPYGFGFGMRHLNGEQAPMTDAESASHAKLLAECQTLEAEYAEVDEYPEEIDARLADLEAAMDALEHRPLVFDPAEVVRSGVFVCLDRDGELSPLAQTARRSITFDRGFALVSWRELDTGMGTKAWFCDPQAQWQKGSVQNMNKRLRRYLPRDTAL